MKILLVNKFLYPKGGAETYTLKIGEELQKRGHSVQYFGMYDEKNTVGNKLNLYTKKMDFHTRKIKKLAYPFKIIYSFEAKRKITMLIKFFKPDIIHLNNINFQLTPSIIDAAYKLKVPIVQTVHDSQIVCPNHLLLNQGQICQKCVNGSKWNCLKYRCIHESRVKSLIGAMESIFYNDIHKAYKKVNLYICPSDFMKDILLSANEKLYAGNTIKITNFIDMKDEINYKKEDYVLYFGRLSEEKGLSVLLKSCEKLSNIKFVIAGTGPLEEECKKLKNVKYVGFKTGKELNEIIGRAKFVIYPSICYENCPLTILEAESLGTPVITVNYGGAKELVTNNKTGILIDKVDVESLSNAIQTLYEDSNKVIEMSKNCINARSKMISLDKYYEILLKLYKNIRGKLE